MRHIRGRLAILLAAAAAACLAWTRSPAAGTPAPPPESARPAAGDHGWNPSADRDAVWVGVAGCSSSSCHHENGPKGSARSEYDTWAGYDKHARAYQVLFNERSGRIARNLYGEGGKPATEQPLCLKCHASHDGVTASGVGDRFQLADGVGCESCHGAAEKWLTVHYRAGFKELSPEDKAALGLRPTKDLVHRARLCTSCHVGGPDKEVNHDLIAAGHPRLAFELGAYHGIYNKHWDVHNDAARYPDFQARLWAVGQLASAKASLELLQARAAGAEKGARPWPEFAEYDCFACHKVLQVDSPRQTAGYGGRRPGALPWGDWYLSPANPLTGEVGMRQAEDDDPLRALRQLMQSPTPDAPGVSRSSGEVVRRIDGVLSGLRADRPMAAGRMRGLFDRYAVAGGERAKAMSWDEATQLYLAMAALENGLSDLGSGSPEVRDRLAEVAGTLRAAFPAGSDSPSRFQPAAVGAELRSVRGRLGE